MGNTRSVECFLAMLLVSVAGCSTWPHHLLFYQNTTIGLDVATDTQASTVHVVFGYDRNTGAYVPKVCVPFATPTPPPAPAMVESVPTPAGSPDPQDCGPWHTQQGMSVIAKTDVEIGWFGNQTVSERFATGEAAQNIAVNDEAIRQLSPVSPVSSGSPAPSPSPSPKGGN